MEFCDAGSLDEAIQHGKFHGGVTEGLRQMRVDLRAVCLTLLDIASAMTHLHSMRIVHKDLKPKNVLLSSCLVRITSNPASCALLCFMHIGQGCAQCNTLPMRANVQQLPCGGVCLMRSAASVGTCHGK